MPGHNFGQETLKALEDPAVQGAIAAIVTDVISGLGLGIVESVVAGANVTVNDADPHNPVVSVAGGGGDSNAEPFSSFFSRDDAALSTVYTNETGRRLLVFFEGNIINSPSGLAGFLWHSTVDGATRIVESFATYNEPLTGQLRVAFVFPVDPGGTYQVGSEGGDSEIQSWTEVGL